MLMFDSHHLLDNGQICRWNIVCYCLYFLLLKIKIYTLTQKRGQWTLNTSISILWKFYSIESVGNVPILARPGPKKRNSQWKKSLPGQDVLCFKNCKTWKSCDWGMCNSGGKITILSHHNIYYFLTVELLQFLKVPCWNLVVVNTHLNNY